MTPEGASLRARTAVNRFKRKAALAAATCWSVSGESTRTSN